jgi:hypothetical protein
MAPSVSPHGPVRMGQDAAVGVDYSRRRGVPARGGGKDRSLNLGRLPPFLWGNFMQAGGRSSATPSMTR